MLVIKIELWPWGQEHQAKQLAKAVIVNTTKNENPEIGDYFAEFITEGNKSSRPGEVKGHARMTEPVWTLLRKALEAAGY